MVDVLRLLEVAVVCGCALLGGTILGGRWLEARREARREARWRRLAYGDETSDETPDPRVRQEALAHDRALLLRLLTPEQAQHYLVTGCFELRTPSGGHYRLWTGAVSNVQALDRQGKATATFCIVPRRRISEPAHLAAQVLLLQSDEAAFHKIANVTKRHP